MPTIINFILSMLLGPRAAQGIQALKATSNLHALVHLVETLSMIESGIRPTLTDDEIRRGLDEFKSILDLGIDNRTDLTEWQKGMQKKRECISCQWLLWRDTIHVREERVFHAN